MDEERRNGNEGEVEEPAEMLNDDQEDEEDDYEDEEPPAIAIRPGQTTAAQPPGDSTWELMEDFAAVVFTQRGRFKVGAVGGLLFMNLFWNGIVSIFVALLFGGLGQGPQGFEWWGLFLFLIPFELIGVLMILALLGAIIEPLRKTRWRFEPGRAERTTTWLGLGRTRTFETDHLDRIDLYGGPAVERTLTIQQHPQPSATQDRACRLTLIDTKEHAVCTIDQLTPGEASWMAHQITRYCARWFKGR